MLGTGRKNIKLDQAEIIDIDPMSGDFRFTVEAFTVNKRLAKVHMVGRLLYFSNDILLTENWAYLLYLGLLLIMGFLRLKDLECWSR